MREAFVGIDVACSKRKRLPINVSVLESGGLTPLPLRAVKAVLPPAGEGNVRVLDDNWLEGFARSTACYLRNLELHLHLCIKRIGIDAPSAPKPNGKSRRQAEVALDTQGISCFATPSPEEFAVIKQNIRAHLAMGCTEVNLPHANQVWMLLGFALFQHLRREWEVIEVYPHATVKALGVSAFRKSSADGLLAHLSAAASYTGWPKTPDLSKLRDTCYGRLHDCLDAYLAAWVASLDESSREPLGVPPDDAIWVPRIELIGSGN